MFSKGKIPILIGSVVIFIMIGAAMLSVSMEPARKAIESSEGEGRFIHVAKYGSDSGVGTKEEPYLTINHAAQQARPGDTVVVHAGLYRETVKPARGGTDETNRITYTVADDGEVVIKGSEEIDSWSQHSGDVWQVSLPNRFFQDYNPYAARHPHGGEGEFFPVYTAGDVYLNEQAYDQRGALGDVVSTVNSWYAEVSDDTTWSCQQKCSLKTPSYRNSVTKLLVTAFFRDK